jgi:hypothetical protein
VPPAPPAPPASEAASAPGEQTAPAPAPDGAAEPASTEGPAAARTGRRTRSRRFPERTRDTARPEGGGRAAPADAPAPARQWPIVLVCVLAGAGLVMVAADTTRPGLVLLGSALLLGGLLRWLLPSVGMLAVRSRFTDVLTYWVLGAAIVLLALMAQPHPVLRLPFLQAVLSFAVRGGDS